MDYYHNMFRGLDDVPVRNDGEYEDYNVFTLPYPFENKPTYGLYFDEVYDTPLAMPKRKELPPQLSCSNAVFRNPNSNVNIPLVKESRSGNKPYLLAYDSPGPGQVRYTPVFMPSSSYSNPLVGPKSLPPVVKR